MTTTLLEFLAFLGNKSAVFAADSGYIESRRSFEADGTLMIELSNLNGTSRSIGFEQTESQYVRFQGTTLRDMKWLAEYGLLKELVLRQPKAGAIAGILELVWKRGGSKRIGWISQECWEQLQEVTRDRVSSRTQVGA